MTTHEGTAYNHRIFPWADQSNFYYYLAVSAGIISVFAPSVAVMPLFTFAFTYVSYRDGGKCMAGIILGILGTLLALLWFCAGVIYRNLMSMV